MTDEATDLGNAGFGLMFYNARWYDPSLGRFAQADTIVPNGVQGLDRYAYVNNSPVNYTDPTGHQSCGPDNIYCGGLAENDYYSQPAPTNNGGNGGGGGEDEEEDGLTEELGLSEEEINDYCIKTNNTTECTWDFSSSDERELFIEFILLLREINEDPLNLDAVGFMPLNYILGALETLMEMSRSDYYAALSNFEDDLSTFSDLTPSVTIDIEFAASTQSNRHGYPPTVGGGSLTANTYGLEGPYNLYIHLDTAPTETMRLMEWFSNGLGN